MSNNKIFTLLAINILLVFSIMVSIFPIAPLISSDLGMTSGEIGTIAGIASLVMTFCPFRLVSSQTGSGGRRLLSPP